MSAQVHPAQNYNRIPAQAQVRRHPFTNAPTLAVNQPQPVQPVQQQQIKPKEKQLPTAPPPAPKSPPLPRQNVKITPPSPPKLITDKSGKFQFQKVGFLGEGGFARVYEVKDMRGSRLACKVVTKASLKTKKAKTKLYAEIKIHRSLAHPNIVGFEECFEDDNNVYMTLELCPSGSLMDMLRRRRRFTEPEARYFMVQLIGACAYMHAHQVIHRDLKLGNLFLDANMNVKVGDFGLAALIESPGERKKTICGTPNYIAPEVLFDTANGHSFEVDTWSIGVILYTLVVGRPPFQTKDVKTIYKRIRDNDYEFPTDRLVSIDSEQLIGKILTPNPQMRPSLHEIVDHAFFTTGTVPSSIPMSAHDSAPDFRHINRATSMANLRHLRRRSLLDEDQTTSIAVPSAPPSGGSSGNNNDVASAAAAKSLTSTIAQQEKEFQKAVQPGSPISALLSSARQPLVMGNSTTPRGENHLLRKLQQVQVRDSQSPGRKRKVSAGGGGMGLHGIEEEEEQVRAMADVNRKKELESQKARIVAQMAPVREEEGQTRAREHHLREREREMHARERERENVMPAPAVPTTRVRSVIAAAPQAPPAPSPRLNAFDAAAHVLSLAFDARATGRLFRDPREDATLPIPEERVFIVSWVDYCNKYGMGYALTDGSVGVHFNDSTTLVLSPDKLHMDYISSRRAGTAFVRKSYTVEAFPEDALKSKVYLLKHFERYIMDRLYGEYEYTFDDVERTRGMEWVQKYLRMKHVIVFKMSHDVLQFNFYDHSKLILSSHGLMVTHIDKNYKRTNWSLSSIMRASLLPPSTLASMDPETVRFQQRLVDKLKYCKEVLLSIKSQSAAAGDGVNEEQTRGDAMKGIEAAARREGMGGGGGGGAAHQRGGSSTTKSSALR